MKKNKKENINIFAVEWIDQVEDALYEVKKVINGALRGINDKNELRKARRELTKGERLINEVWGSLREIEKEKMKCLNDFRNWKSGRSMQVLMFLDKKLEKEYLPMFEVMAKGEKKTA